MHYLAFGVLLIWVILPGCAAAPAACPGVNANPRIEPRPEATIYVVKRAWHIDIGFTAAELHSPLASVREAVPEARYVLFGFGDKRYLLAHGRSFGLLGAVWPGEGLVLLTSLEVTPEEGFGAEHVIRLSVSAAQELELERFVWKTLAMENGAAKSLGPGPYTGALYYASAMRYSGLHTCNTWAAEALHAAGLPVHTFGVELSGQVWRQVKRINRRAACYRPDTPPSSRNLEERPPSSSAEVGCCC
jgi:hypothetical protein